MARSAEWGGMVWLGLLCLAATGRGPFWAIELLFLLAPLVLVPLALDLVGLGRATWLRVLQRAAALSLIASFLAGRGPGAAVLASGWLALTAALAWQGLARLRARGPRDPAETVIDAGLLLVPVGGGWLVLSRLGATPLGFEEPMVLLTAVHFHYAALLTLVLVGVAGRVLGPSNIYRAAAAGTIAGTPMLAAGITLSPTLELAGAAILAGSLWTFAGLSLVALRRHVRGAARGFLLVSALSLFPSMALALAYAWGEYTGRPVVALSSVALAHGTLNAMGFVGCGLLGWTLVSRNRRGGPL